MATRVQRLKSEAFSATKAARAIAEQADNGNRDMTEDERRDYDAHMAKARRIVNDELPTAKADEQVLEQAGAFADSIGVEGGAADLKAQGSDPERADAKSLGLEIVSSPQFKALMAPYGGRPIPEKARVQSDPIPFTTLVQGAKALIVGGSNTSGGAFLANERTDIVEMLGRRTLTVRDLVSVRRTAADAVDYVIQTSHTNAAAPVAEATSSAAPTTGASSGAALTLDPNGGYKPEGAWAFAEATANVRTIAEWVPATKRALADVAAMEGLINSELVLDLAEAEETQMVSGNGTGQNLPGILNTSGIQTRTAVTTTDADWFGNFRVAKRLAKTVGRVNPNAILVNPTQGEKIDVAKDAQGRFFGGGPFGVTNPSLWGMPVVESEAIPAGTALVGDFSKAVLWDREQASVTMTDSHADFFIRNLVAVLAEERVAFAVTRPTAFVTITGL